MFVSLIITFHFVEYHFFVFRCLAINKRVELCALTFYTTPSGPAVQVHVRRYNTVRFVDYHFSFRRMSLFVFKCLAINTRVELHCLIYELHPEHRLPQSKSMYVSYSMFVSLIITFVISFRRISLLVLKCFKGLLYSTKRNETKRNETKRNEMKRNETK